MRKLLLVISFLLGLTTLTLAGPKLLIPVTHWDVGRVPQNTKINHAYWILNIGDDTLRIVQVKPG
jgi:hypothetical protein